MTNPLKIEGWPKQIKEDHEQKCICTCCALDKMIALIESLLSAEVAKGKKLVKVPSREDIVSRIMEIGFLKTDPLFMTIEDKRGLTQWASCYITDKILKLIEESK